MSRKFGVLFAVLMIAGLILGACAQPTPETVIQTVEVVTTVEVPKEVEVVTTVEVEKEVVTTIEVPMKVKESAVLAIEHFSVIEETT